MVDATGRAQLLRILQRLTEDGVAVVHATHAPTEQKGVGAAHACPQLPQFAASDIVFEHVEPQEVSGAMQVHMLPVQTWESPHLVAQLPQLLHAACSTPT